MQGKELKLKKYYAEKFSETTGIYIQSQHWVGNSKLSMEGIGIEYFLDSVYDCKYSLMIGNNNNWNIIHCIDYGTDDVKY